MQMTRGEAKPLAVVVQVATTAWPWIEVSPHGRPHEGADTIAWLASKGTELRCTSGFLG